MKIAKHIIFIIAALFVFLGIPTLLCVDIPALFSGENADVVSGASLEIPDQPSGEFYVLVNKERHAGTMDQWETFFSGQDAGVIMNDIDCMVVDADATGTQLAERYQKRLAENQMTLRKEAGLMLASKAENQLFDTIIMSKEFAEAYQLQSVSERPKITTITVKGE